MQMRAGVVEVGPVQPHRGPFGHVAAGHHLAGDRGQRGEQRLHLVVVQGGEWREGQGVGGVLDVPFERVSVGGQRTGGVEQPPLAQRIPVQLPLRVVVVTAAPDHGLVHPSRRGMQNIGFAPRDPFGHQHRDVPVATVLA
ncbi:hypothetical protein JDV09_13765 [Mycobacterium sp. Y57]|nr:hypothetical protein [Mycolicibacterium xanthum]